MSLKTLDGRKLTYRNEQARAFHDEVAAFLGG
jgi:hypothetical protein